MFQRHRLDYTVHAVEGFILVEICSPSRVQIFFAFIPSPISKSQRDYGGLWFVYCFYSHAIVTERPSSALPAFCTAILPKANGYNFRLLWLLWQSSKYKRPYQYMLDLCIERAAVVYSHRRVSFKNGTLFNWCPLNLA